jgi:pimeloyl-ACP methyl ester carboxylesterase
VPSTAAGTAYTVFTDSSDPDAGTARWAYRDSLEGASNIPTILYLHGAGAGSNQFETLTAWTTLRNWLIDNGWAWIEGTGGGTQPWGNAASRTAYRATFDIADAEFDIGPLVILARSMGGLAGHWLFTQDPVIKVRSVGFIGNSEVANLAAAYASGNWTDAMRAAYGVSTDVGFASASEGFDPLLFSASLWAGKKVLEIVGTADTTVPRADHGLAMRTHWAGQPALDLLTTRSGGDHSGTNGSYLEVDAMTAFLLEVTGEAPEPPPPPRMFRVAKRYIIDSSGVRRRVPIVQPDTIT